MRGMIRSGILSPVSSHLVSESYDRTMKWVKKEVANLEHKARMEDFIKQEKQDLQKPQQKKQSNLQPKQHNKPSPKVQENNNSRTNAANDNNKNQELINKTRDNDSLNQQDINFDLIQSQGINIIDTLSSNSANDNLLNTVNNNTTKMNQMLFWDSLGRINSKINEQDKVLNTTYLWDINKQHALYTKENLIDSKNRLKNPDYGFVGLMSKFNRQYKDVPFFSIDNVRLPLNLIGTGIKGICQEANKVSDILIPEQKAEAIGVLQLGLSGTVYGGDRLLKKMMGDENTRILYTNAKKRIDQANILYGNYVSPYFKPNEGEKELLTLGLGGVAGKMGYGAFKTLGNIAIPVRKSMLVKSTVSQDAFVGNATGFLGRPGFELKNISYQKTRNKPVKIGNRYFTGHALDQMQNRGIPPTVVEHAITRGKPAPGNIKGRTVYRDIKNNISVITDTLTGRVITVRGGQ